MRAADVARALTGTPTDSLPADPGPPWRTVAEIGARPDYANGLPTITTGFASLDHILQGGFRKESTYALAGRTGTSKSTLAMNVARKVALSGHTVLIFKLEESAREAVYRMHAAAAQVSLDLLLGGPRRLNPQTHEKLTDGWSLISKLPVRISDQRDLDAMSRISAEHVKQDGGLIIVDQLSMVEVRGTEFGYERATTISNHLRILARDLQVPILIVAQVNREAAKKKNERLGVNDLRDSGAIENDASAVILIDRVRKPDGPEYSGAELVRYLQIVVPKNRYGPIVEEVPIELFWWPQTCRIEEIVRCDPEVPT